MLVGRFVAIGRVAIAWLAGADEMPWRRFALPNAAGSIAWAGVVGGLVYAVGTSSAHWLAVAGVAVGLLAVTHLWWRSRQGRRAWRGDRPDAPSRR